MKNFAKIIIVVALCFLNLFLNSCDSKSGIKIDILEETTNKVPTVKVYTDISVCEINYDFKDEKNLELLAAENEKYIFEGWVIRTSTEEILISHRKNTLVDISNAMYQEYLVNGCLHIYATYRQLLKIEYILNGGEFEEDPPLYYDTKNEEIFLPNNLTKEGYVFVGWKDEKGQIIDTVLEDTKGEINLEAQWYLDYRSELIGRTFNYRLSNQQIGMFSFHDLYIHFIDEKYVDVYSKIDNLYLNMGYCYLSNIHTLAFFGETRQNEIKALYNDWDFGNLRQQKNYFEYRILSDKIEIKLSSDDEIYSKYIKKYFNDSIYYFTYNSHESLYFNYFDENDLLLIDQKDQEKLRVYSAVLSGDNSTTSKNYNVIGSLGIFSKEDISIEDIKNNEYSMDIGQLKNKTFDSPLDDYSLIYGITTISNYNMFMPRFSCIEDKNGFLKYYIDYYSVYDMLSGINYFCLNNKGQNEVIIFFTSIGLCVNLSKTAGLSLTIEGRTVGQDFWVVWKNFLGEEVIESPYLKSFSEAEKKNMYWAYGDLS